MKEGHIFVEGFIDQDYERFINQKLAALSNVDKIILHINSPGGSVYGGYKAYNSLVSSGKPIEAIIEGECQSIATLIMLAAGKITARNPSVIMIHNPYQGVEGDADQLESGANELRAIEETMIGLYAEKTKLPPDQIRDMMKKQTSMNAEQAVKLGFVDTALPTLKAVAVGKPITKTMENEHKGLIDRFGAAMAAFKSALFGPQNMDIKTDKGMVSIDTTDGEFVGKPATVAGAPAPDGDYKLDDGRVMTVAGGIITAITEAANATPPPAQDTPEQVRIKALEAELTALKAQSAAAEAAKVEAEAKNTKVAQMYATLETEFTEIKKRTVGDSKPPKAAAVLKKEPAGEDDEEDTGMSALQAEVFKKSGIYHLTKQN